MNPHLRQHPLYLTNNVPEYVWKTVTWVRPGSHWLKIETEQWLKECTSKSNHFVEGYWSAVVTKLCYIWFIFWYH